MHCRRRPPLAALALALAVGLPGGFALPAVAQRPPAQGSGPRGEMRPEIRERVKQKIQTYLTVELSTRLGLDQKKSLQLGQALAAHMERRQQQRQRLKAEAQKLRGLVDAKAADAQLKSQLDIVIGLAGRDDEVQRLLQETSKFLTVTEQAQLALAMPEVMRDMRHMMREGRRGGRGGPGGPGFGPGGPGGPGGFGGLDDEE